MEIVSDDVLGHSVEERYFCAGLDLQVHCSELSRLSSTRVYDDELGAVLDGALHPNRPDDGMGVRGIAAHEQ
jgi:hypothetical protein